MTDATAKRTFAEMLDKWRKPFIFLDGRACADEAQVIFDELEALSVEMEEELAKWESLSISSNSFGIQMSLIQDSFQKVLGERQGQLPVKGAER